MSSKLAILFVVGAPSHSGKSWIHHCSGLCRVLADVYVTTVEHQGFSDLSNQGALGIVIIFRMPSIRIYPNLSLYSIMNPNWFLLLFTARKSSCEKVMFSQACVSHSVHRGWLSLGPCPFWGWISLVSSPFQEVGMSGGVGMSRGMFMFRAGYV